MKNSFIILIITVLLAITSCSGYQKLLKSANHDLKYQKALEYYEQKDYVKALSLLEGLSSVYIGTDRAEDVLYYYSYCHYFTGDYILGGYYFRHYVETYPRGKYVEEFSYMGAYCYYLDSPRSSLDQTNTHKAIKELQMFIDKYPSSEKVALCNDLIDGLRGKLEEKSFNNAKLYYNLALYKAANITLENSLEDYPDSKYREETLFLIVKSNYELSIRSVDELLEKRYKNTIERCRDFIEEFPESKYRENVDKMYRAIKIRLSRLT